MLKTKVFVGLQLNSVCENPYSIQLPLSGLKRFWVDLLLTSDDVMKTFEKFEKCWKMLKAEVFVWL